MNSRRRRSSEVIYPYRRVNERRSRARFVAQPRVHTPHGSWTGGTCGWCDVDEDADAESDELSAQEQAKADREAARAERRAAREAAKAEHDAARAARQSGDVSNGGNGGGGGNGHGRGGGKP